MVSVLKTLEDGIRLNISVWPMCHKECCLFNSFLVIYTALVMLYKGFDNNMFTYLIEKTNGLNFNGYICTPQKKKIGKTYIQILTL